MSIKKTFIGSGGAAPQPMNPIKEQWYGRVGGGGEAPTQDTSREWASDLKDRVMALIIRAVMNERHDIEKLIESAIERSCDKEILTELLRSVTSRTINFNRI